MATQLTPEEKALLKTIVEDKFSIGAFSGMVFNALQDKGWNATPENIDLLTQKALATRLRLKELSQ